jgi:hypothetical protein
MIQELIVELSDGVYAALNQLAGVVGATPASLAAEVIERSYRSGQDTRTEAEKQAARERFRRHAGAVSMGYATGMDNESIDADLAREYGSTGDEGF